MSILFISLFFMSFRIHLCVSMCFSFLSRTKNYSSHRYVIIYISCHLQVCNCLCFLPEEVLIVVAVLLLWVAAIALFFNRWGKIRMLEPYQPKFQQQHRSSCPLVEMEAIPALKHPSFSRISMGCSLQMPTSGRMGSISGPSGPSVYTCNTARGKFKTQFRVSSVFFFQFLF